MQKLVILGGGYGFGEICELVEDINRASRTYDIVAILDDNPALIGKAYGGITVEGPLERARDYNPDVKFVFAIGSYRTRVLRSEILKRIEIPDARYATLVHPSAKIFRTCKVGEGCVIHYGSVLFNDTSIGPFCVISANCVIGVANIIGRGALVGSNVTTTTGVRIGPFSFVGSSSSISENVEIEPGAYIGLGSVVARNVSAGTFVFGNPPRMLERIDVPKTLIEEWEHFKKNQEREHHER